jgi:hypothetical protein
MQGLACSFILSFWFVIIIGVWGCIVFYFLKVNFGVAFGTFSGKYLCPCPFVGGGIVNTEIVLAFLIVASVFYSHRGYWFVVFYAAAAVARMFFSILCGGGLG